MFPLQDRSPQYQQHLALIDPTNPFELSSGKVGDLSPRRESYIQQRNVAQDERISDVANAIIGYRSVIATVQVRYRTAELEEQLLLKPYLTILYFEMGQLFEEQKCPQDALRYYEQAARHGHFASIESAKRLGTTLSFPARETANLRTLAPVGSSPVDERTLFSTLDSVVVLIKSDTQKGSGFLAKDETLGTVLITVKHVVTPGATACLRDREIPLDSLRCCERGSNVFFLLEDKCEIPRNTPTILTEGNLHVGEKVYFSGFPFNTRNLHIHTGYVSSLGGRRQFSIDGTAVPGMSGGPIAIQREGTLYIVGTMASETFDPIEGFSRALGAMYGDQADMEVRYAEVQEIQEETAASLRNNPQFTTIPRGSLYIGDLAEEQTRDSEFFNNIWDDLHKHGVIAHDGRIYAQRVMPGNLGLRAELQQYEEKIVGCLQARIRMNSIDPSTIEMPFSWKEPTDALNMIGLSLVQSLSTGVVTGNFFQQPPKKTLDASSSQTQSVDSSSADESDSGQFDIGRTKRIEKVKKQQKQAARAIRAKMERAEGLQRTGLPLLIYRFVSTEAAKEIKKNGIVHEGEAADEIHFMAGSKKHIARSVGAVSAQKMVTVYTDRIPGLTADQVRMVSERNGTWTYRINRSIPKEAIEISESG